MFWLLSLFYDSKTVRIYILRNCRHFSLLLLYSTCIKVYKSIQWNVNCSLHHSCETFVKNNDRFNRLNKEPKLLVKVVAHALNYVHVQSYYKYKY